MDIHGGLEDGWHTECPPVVRLLVRWNVAIRVGVGLDGEPTPVVALTTDMPLPHHRFAA